MITNNRALVSGWMSAKLDGEVECQAALGLVCNETIHAGVVYNDWNGVSVTATIAVEGIMTPSYLAAIFHYPFIHLGAKKIICQIGEKNQKSIHLCEKMGFRKEAQLLDSHPDGRLLLYTMSKEQCRFIGERYVKKLRVA